MKRSEFVEITGLVTIVASLLFVGLEIRQNNAIALAQTRQAVLDTYVDFQLTMWENPEILRASSAQFGAPPSDLGAAAAAAPVALFAQLRMLENVYLQVEEGLGDESFFRSYGWSEQPIFRTDQFAAFWSSIRLRFHPGFVGRFEAEYGLAP